MLAAENASMGKVNCKSFSSIDHYLKKEQKQYFSSSLIEALVWFGRIIV